MYIRRRVRFRLGFIFLTLLLLYTFRHSIYRAMSGYLISEDKLEQADAIFVLAGVPYERGMEAVRLMNEGYSDRIVCLGGEYSDPLLTWGLQVKTCQLTQKVLLDAGVDSTKIDLLCEGSSTFEEYKAIRDYSEAHSLKKIILVTSRFHTRRVGWVFDRLESDTGTRVIVRGSPQRAFREEEWWNYEQGLLFLNNEYLKLAYYKLRY